MRTQAMIQVTVLLALGVSCAEPHQQTSAEVVTAFVSGAYPHGVPYDKALALSNAVKAANEESLETTLLRLLDHPVSPVNQNNVVVTLGMVGSQAVVSRIRQTIEAGSGELQYPEVSLRMDAVMALGYAAYGGHADAVTYLIRGAKEPGAWSDIKWRLPGNGNPESQLRKRSIAALGLSANPEGLGVLKNLLSAAKESSGGGRGGGAAAMTSQQALLEEAVRTNEFIASQPPNPPNGMIEYYRTFLK